MEDAILYSSCFDANGGLFETLLSAEDAVLSDELNHASVIDGIRLCKAQRFRYRNNDMADLKARLEEAEDARFRMIATDGVFSMDGSIANLAPICDLAEEYECLVMVDDSHASGVPRRARPRHATSTAASWAAWTSLRVPSARPSAAPRAGSPRGARRSSPSSASAPALTSSPTPSPPPWSPPRLKALDLVACFAATCAARLVGRTPSASGAD